MKLISEGVVLVIIASAMITVSLTVFYFAMSNLHYSTLTSEYGYIMNTFVNLADSVPDIINGEGFGTGLPKRLVGVGYLKYGSELPFDHYNVTIRIQRSGGYTFIYEDSPIKLYAKAQLAVATPSRLIYGRNDFIVNDLLLIAKVKEYYYRGFTYLTLDTARVYLKTTEYIYADQTGTHRSLHVYIMYIKINVVTQPDPKTMVVNRGVDLVNERFLDVTDLKIVFRNESAVKTVLLSDLVPNLQNYDELLVTLIVRELNVVLM